MTKLILLLLALTLCCGFVMPETCSQRSARDKIKRKWAKNVASHYDLDALSVFLRRSTTEKKSWNGVDLTKASVGARWDIIGTGMTSGDWVFETDDPSSRDFTLSFIYEGGKRWLIMHCRRESDKKFVMTAISSEDVVVLDL